MNKKSQEVSFLLSGLHGSLVQVFFTKNGKEVSDFPTFMTLKLPIVVQFFFILDLLNYIVYTRCLIDQLVQGIKFCSTFRQGPSWFRIPQGASSLPSAFKRRKRRWEENTSTRVLFLLCVFLSSLFVCCPILFSFFTC